MAKSGGWFRANEKVILAVLCSILMASWLILPRLRDLLTGSDDIVGEIFGEEVSRRELHALAANLEADPPREGEAESFLLTPWVMLVWAEEAKRCGITVTDEEVAEYLEERFRTSSDESFDGRLYQDFLRDQRLPAGAYEDAVHVRLAAGKLLETIWNSAALPTEEAWTWHARDTQKVKAAYIRLRAKDFLDVVKVTEKEIRDTYERFADKKPEKDPEGFGRGYLEPRKVKIEYVIAPSDKYTKDPLITERQVRAYYEQNKERDFKVRPPDSTDDKKGDKAGKDKKPTYQPFADVAADIEEKLRLAEARDIAWDVMADINEKVRRSVKYDRRARKYLPLNLKGIVKEAGLEPRITGFFAPNNPPKGLFGAFTLRNQNFTRTQRGLISRRYPLRAENGPFIFRTLEIQPEVPAEYERIEDKVREHVRLKKALDMATEIAGRAVRAPNLDEAEKQVEKEIAGRLQNAPEKGKAKKAADLFKRDESKVFSNPMHGRSRSIRDATGVSEEFDDRAFAATAFALREGELGMAVLDPARPRVVFVLQRTAALPADRKEFDKDCDRIKQALLRRKQRAVVRTWLEQVLRRAQPSKSFLDTLGARR